LFPGAEKRKKARAAVAQQASGLPLGWANEKARSSQPEAGQATDADERLHSIKQQPPIEVSANI